MEAGNRGLASARRRNTSRGVRFSSEASRRPHPSREKGVLLEALARDMHSLPHGSLGRVHSSGDGLLRVPSPQRTPSATVPRAMRSSSLRSISTGTLAAIVNGGPHRTLNSRHRGGSRGGGGSLRSARSASSLPAVLSSSWDKRGAVPQATRGSGFAHAAAFSAPPPPRAASGDPQAPPLSAAQQWQLSTLLAYARLEAPSAPQCGDIVIDAALQDLSDGLLDLLETCSATERDQAIRLWRGFRSVYAHRDRQRSVAHQLRLSRAEAMMGRLTSKKDVPDANASMDEWANHLDEQATLRKAQEDITQLSEKLLDAETQASHAKSEQELSAITNESYKDRLQKAERRERSMSEFVEKLKDEVTLWRARASELEQTVELGRGERTIAEQVTRNARADAKILACGQTCL